MQRDLERRLVTTLCGVTEYVAAVHLLDENEVYFSKED